MAERILSPTIHLTILGVLLLLTVLTVGVSFVPMAGQWHILCGLIIASLKGSLVVLFFMHALYSPRLTWIVIIASLGWIAILFTLTLCDYLTRGQVPYMPGH